MALPIFAQKIKKTITKYFPSPAWPWEIVSGLFIVLIMINGLTLFSEDSLSINRTFFVFVIVAVNLLWGTFDGLMLIFTNLLEEGRYNKMISRIKSSDKKLATELRTLQDLAKEEPEIASVLKAKESVLKEKIDLFKKELADLESNKQQ